MSEVLLFGSCICALITAYILFFHASAYARYSVRLLGWVMVIYTYCTSGYLLIYSKLILKVPFLYKTFAPLNLLIPPLFYLYIKSVLNDEKKMRLKDVIHILPFVFFVINYFPFYLMPINEKYNLVKKVVLHYSLNYESQDGIVPEYFYYISRILQAFLYVILQMRLIRKAQITKSIYNRLPHAESVMKWLKYLTIVPGITILSIFFMLIMIVNGWGSPNDNSLNLPFLILSLSVFAFCVFLLMHPHVLYGFPDFAKTKSNYNIVEIEDAINEENSAYGLKSEEDLVSETFAFEIERIELAFKNDAIYLRPNLSISILSVILEIPARDLSFIINKHYNLRFNDFINKYRIAFVVKKINDQYLENYTLESLYLQSGFVNKSTFNTAFKKFQDCTPSEYIKKFDTMSGSE